MSVFDEVFDRITDKECVIFLGAGSSLASKAPSGSKLLNMIVDHFVGNATLIHDLTTAFDFACGRDEINRKNVEDFLRDLFLRLKPNRGHEIMRQFRWPAIFTTNYDRVIEDAYGHSERSQELKTVYQQRGAELDLNVPDVVPLFKLFGCISGTRDRSVPLVLTSSDFQSFRRDREWMLDALIRLAKSNTWLFIGYSFADGVILNLLRELVGTPAWRYQPKCYVVLPQVTEQDQRFLETYKLSSITDTFVGFFEKLDRKYSSETRRILFATRVSTRPKIRGEEVEEIDPGVRKEMHEQFELLTDQVLEMDTAENLLKGYPPSWGDIAKGYDIERKICARIKKVIRDDLAREDQEATFYVLASAAGAGKSTLLKRIGYDLYQEGMPVIWLRPLAEWKTETIEKVHVHFGRRVLALIDDGHLCYAKALDMYYRLRGRDVPVTILIGIRKGDYNVLPLKRRPFDDVEPDFTLPYELEDPEELRNLVLSLQANGFIRFDSLHDAKYWTEYYLNRANRNLLVTMMEATQQRAFEEIVIDEYDSLAGTFSQGAYKYICGLYQYGIPLNPELLVPALECSWEQFLREIRKGKAELTIVERGDAYTGLYYEARHQLIARKVAEAVFQDAEALTAFIEALIDAAYPGDAKQEQIILDLVRDRELERDLHSFANLERIFLKAILRFANNESFLLHYAILLRSEAKFDMAEKILRDARRINEKNVAVVHQLGMVFRDKARNEAAKGTTLRMKLLEDAGRQFALCRSLNPTDEYGYHSHAEMLKDMRKQEIANEDQKDAWLLQAIEITADALKQVALPKQRLLADLYHSLIAELGRIEEARQYFLSRTRAGAGPDTFCLWGRMELEEGGVDEALGIATEALARWKDNSGLIALAGDCAENMLERTGRADSLVLGHLRQSVEKRPDRADFRLRYAVALYEAGQFSQSAGQFEKARFSCPESISRTAIRYKWVDNEGNLLTRKGKAIKRNERWTTEATDLPPVHLSTRYAEEKAIKPGQSVSYQIGFNYMGAIAIL